MRKGKELTALHKIVDTTIFSYLFLANDPHIYSCSTQRKLLYCDRHTKRKQG